MCQSPAHAATGRARAAPASSAARSTFGRTQGWLGFSLTFKRHALGFCGQLHVVVPVRVVCLLKAGQGKAPFAMQGLPRNDLYKTKVSGVWMPTSPRLRKVCSAKLR